MIIFWQHFFIVVVEASSSRALLLLPTFHHFPPFLYARTCVRNYCGVPTVPFVPASLFITLFFLQRGTPAVSVRKKHYCSFHRLEIKSCYSIGSPYMFFVRFIYTLFMQVHYRLLITNLYHPIRQRSTIVPTDDKKD